MNSHHELCPATECGCERGEECGPSCIHTCQCRLICKAETAAIRRLNKAILDDVERGLRGCLDGRAFAAGNEPLIPLDRALRAVKRLRMTVGEQS